MPLLTQHFSVNELSVTTHPYYNVPGPVAELYLLRLAELVLEPLRTLWGCPIQINSAYRSEAVNTRCGGRPNSPHLAGRAADLEPLGITLDEGMRRLAGSAIPFDQALLESFGGARWIHVSIPKIYERPRRQALVTQDGTNWATYTVQPPAGGLA